MRNKNEIKIPESCSLILMSEGLIKSMRTALPSGVDGALESSSGGVLGPGDSGDDSREESDEEYEEGEATLSLSSSGYVV